MKGPKPPAILLHEEQSHALNAFARAHLTPQLLAIRARIVLACAQGLNNEQCARLLNISVHTARKWRSRWLRDAAVPLSELSLAERLSDDPRPGTPTRITPEQVRQIVALACALPEASGRPLSQWSGRELAKAIVERGIVETISPRHASRLLKKRSPGSLPQRPPTAPAARLADRQSRPSV